MFQYGRSPISDPVCSPTLADRDRAPDCVVEIIKDAPDFLVCEAAAVEEMLVNPVREDYLVFGANLEAVEQICNVRIAPRRAGAGELVLDRIVACAFAEAPLGIPVDEAEKSIRFVAGNSPVVVRPIVIGGVDEW